MMVARIYKKTKIATQSGKRLRERWYLEYIPTRIVIEPVMGWFSGSNMYASEVKLEFYSREEAEKYALSSSIEYEIIEPLIISRTVNSYIKNFL